MIFSNGFLGCIHVQSLIQIGSNRGEYVGVRAWDGWRKEWVTLTASLLQVSGDQPAISSLMGMKGHRGKYPCRHCMLCGIRLGTSYYYPLETPADLPPNLGRPIPTYSGLTLPYRENSERL